MKSEQNKKFREILIYHESYTMNKCIAAYIEEEEIKLDQLDWVYDLVCKCFEMKKEEIASVWFDDKNNKIKFNSF